MVLIGLLSFNFQVLMPLLAHTTWHGTATTYALMTAAMGVGSVCGALLAGGRGQISPRLIVGSATAFGVFELLAAVAPSLPLQILALVPLGAVSRDLRSGRQLVAAARRRARDAGARDVALLGGLPRLDADRCPARGLAGPGDVSRAPGSRSAAPRRWSRRPARASPTPAGARARSS